ncbi:PspC domain-containing protein [Nocardia lijiangensis]|uniref:PspC domain-containing protein n=1 Tax=Nocardia lijiangensis TaxID=299618 RepID=UPI00157BCE9A|nr:PspC domain-containing protein [Nocardia lijiangensis]
MGNMTRTTFGDQLQQMWQTRPVRLPRQGPIAGVAAGFGQRYNVDPVLVRVAFVVSTLFGGAGIVLYLLAWLLLNESGDQSSAAESLFGKGHSSQSQTKTVVLIVALAIAVTTVGPIGVGLAGSGMISTALLLAGWWMLFMRCPQPPPGTSALDGGFVDSGFADGLAATGYPGAVFPTGPLRTPGYPIPDVPPVYSPYTKLPDSYVPDTPREPETSVLPADASETVSLDKDVDRPAEVIDAKTEVLDARTSSPRSNTEDVDAPPLSLDKPDRPADPKTLAEKPARTPAPAAFPSVTPPSWDPLGVAPLAWDLPEPAPARPVAVPPPRRPRSRLTPVVIGLAMLAAAGAGAIAAAGADWMTPGRIASAALAVIGLGLVLGAFLRRGYGLLVVTAPLAGFVLLASMIGPIEFDRGAMGEHVWAPATMAELQQDYQISMGSGTLDLRSLNLTENRTVNVDVQMGEARILVPEGMTVRTGCTVTMGENLCPQGVTGPNTPGAPVLDLDVDVHLGSVEVQRG